MTSLDHYITMTSLDYYIIDYSSPFLSDVMGSITGATSSCSTILLDDQLVHLGYIQYGKEMLLVAMPASVVSQYQVQLLVESVERTLELLYNSVRTYVCTFLFNLGINH